MTDKHWVALCFTLSAIVSLVIVLHSYSYLVDVFTYHPWLIFALVALIEILYITVPYISTLNISYTWVDKTLVGLLFFVSVIPATLQLTNEFQSDITSKMIVEPVAPKQSSLVGNYQIQIKDLTKQIEKNQAVIEKLTNKNFITKSEIYVTQNLQLTNKKGELVEKLDKLETKYVTKKTQYDEKIVTFKNIEKQETFNSFFDFIKITWTLLLVSIFQLVNSRLAWHGTEILQRIKSTSDINKNEPEEPKTPITKEFLLDNFKATGVGNETVKKFMDMFNVHTAENLRKFIDSDFEPKIKEKFTHDTAIKLNRFCNVIKRRLEK